MISVIVNCYNQQKYIREAIYSLLNQNYKGEYEILVINDASTDDSLKILQEFKDEKIQIINLTENKGARYGVELAFAKSKGEYICRFDGDDIWKPEFLKTTSAILDKYPEISMVYSDVSFINENSTIVSERNNINRRLKNQAVLDREFIDILYDYYINAPTIMFRKEAFAKAIPMPSFFTNFIDYYISLKVLEHGKAYYIDEPLACYRVHSDNGHKKVIKNKTNEEVTNFILKNLVYQNHSLSNTLKKDIAASNYLRMANDYFGMDMFNYARTNYLKSLINNKNNFFKKNVLKHLIGTLIGNSIYRKLSSFLKFSK